MVDITAVVVTYNEERYLCACLAALREFKEMIVIDLGSSDRCVSIADACNARVYHHDRVEIVEKLGNFIQSIVRTDWYIRIDPDEIIAGDTFAGIQRAIDREGTQIGCIGIPRENYFRAKRLNYTRWGGLTYLGRVFHRDRISVVGDVHHGTEMASGYRYFVLTEVGAIRHFWCDSYGQLIRKHARYLRYEGEALFNAGRRFSLYKMLRRTSGALYESFVTRSSWRGGLHGCMLGLFWPVYIFSADISLLMYQLSTAGVSNKNWK